MAASFRAIATLMDPVTPPASLRELIARHRWLPGQAPSPRSFRGVAARHAHPQTSRHRFLNYNTFLLPGIDIEFQLGEVLAQLGLSALEALLQLELQAHITLAGVMARYSVDAVDALVNLVGVDKTSEFLGVSLEDAVEAGLLAGLLGGVAGPIGVAIGAGAVAAKIADMSATEKIIALLAEAHKTAVEALGLAGVTLARLLTWWLFDPLQILIDFNVDPQQLLWLLFKVAIPAPWRVGDKPALEERATAIGQVCAASGYDILALSEVWDQQPDKDAARKRILGAWDGSSRMVHATWGPEKAGDALLDSGLFRITLDGRRIVESQTLIFENRGNRVQDTDAWACKGVLLTRIDVGVGVIDLYNTHCISGNDLLGHSDVGKHIPALQVPEGYEDALRLAQAGELREFVRTSHLPENVAIICGDTNIRAEEAAPGFPETPTYRALKGLLTDIPLEAKPVSVSFDDLWAMQRAFRPARLNNQGYTHGDSDVSERFAEHCPVMPSPDDPDQAECDEQQATNPQHGGRIDFIFIERPTADHAFTLDCSRVRRRPFRHAGLPEQQLYLSDHLGLDLTLIASPR